MASIGAPRAKRIKRSLAQSTSITATWIWFMILAAKAAEPVLVASVLYASVKLLPLVHFPPQYDVVVFIAQFVALDIGGLSLNTLADQAKQEGNNERVSQDILVKHSVGARVGRQHSAPLGLESSSLVAAQGRWCCASATITPAC